MLSPHWGNILGVLDALLAQLKENHVPAFLVGPLFLPPQPACVPNPCTPSMVSTYLGTTDIVITDMTPCSPTGALMCDCQNASNVCPATG